MQKTKECIMCFSQIDIRSKKCPHCTSLQAKYSNLENNPILIGLLCFLIVGIFSFIFYDNFYMRDIKEKALQELKVIVTEVSTKNESDGLYVACIGHIKNDTEFKFKEIKFQVDFMSENNELVDTFATTDENIDVLPNTSTNFRVRSIGHKGAHDYKNCVVKIVDGWSNT